MCRWLALLSLTALLCFGTPVRPEEKAVPEGFLPLFNGKDLTGWTTNKGGKIDRWVRRERRHLHQGWWRRLVDDREGVRRFRGPR